MSVTEYTRSRTLSDLRLETSAWLQSWALPLRMMFGEDEKSGSGPRKVGPSAGRKGGMPSWFRQKTGYTYHGHDLGPTEGESVAGRGEAADWNHSTAVLRQSWSGAAAQFGGHGISRQPIAAKYGVDRRVAG